MRASKVMSERIDEISRRWPDFQGGRPITLPDGQDWQFYEPEAVLRNGLEGWTFGADVPPDVDAVLSSRFSKVIYKWKRARSDADRASVVLEAAWFLLARNYAVTADEFEGVLSTSSGDEATTLGLELRRLVDEACDRAVAVKGVA
jgi:hypothetical protein